MNHPFRFLLKRKQGIEKVKCKFLQSMKYKHHTIGGANPRIGAGLDRKQRISPPIKKKKMIKKTHNTVPMYPCSSS